MTPFIGVRISWHMVARNCDLASEALSASSRRASSSSLRSTSAVTSQLTPTICELPAGAAIDRADRADVAHAAAGQHQPVVGDIAAGDLDRLAELGLGAGEIVRVQPVAPVGVVVRGGRRRIAVELVHPVVPDQHVGIEVEVPDPDLRGVEREPQPARQLRELGLAVAQRAIVCCRSSTRRRVRIIGPTISAAASSVSSRIGQRAAGRGSQPPAGAACSAQSPPGSATGTSTGTPIAASAPAMRSAPGPPPAPAPGPASARPRPSGRRRRRR